MKKKSKDPIRRAADLLEEQACSLKECCTLGPAFEWSTRLTSSNERLAKAEYDELMKLVARLRAIPRQARPRCYVVEHEWDGYCQRYSKIGGWADVLKWAVDGSIKEGEAVEALYPCKQPKIRKTK